MFDTATHISLSTSIFERYFVFIIPTAEKPVSHMQEVAKGIKTPRACFDIKGAIAIDGVLF